MRRQRLSPWVARVVLAPLLMLAPGALLILFGVLGCNQEATRMIGYDGVIEAPAPRAETGRRP